MKYFKAFLFTLVILAASFYILAVPPEPSSYMVETANVRDLSLFVFLNFFIIVSCFGAVYFLVFSKRWLYLILFILVAKSFVLISFSKAIAYTHAIRFIKENKDIWVGKSWAIQNTIICGEPKDSLVHGVYPQNDYLFAEVSSSKIRILCPYNSTLATIPYRTEDVVLKPFIKNS
ncbi:MAG: hypothetical protein K0S08_668 [Gammaproteobacteria bacterium]|jgi:hypothetical protein|nr:hypothetical protein [Gammaproteobacteria bacterium]